MPRPVTAPYRSQLLLRHGLPTPFAFPFPATLQFLVFQLSINLVAMISACAGALIGGVPPLNVLQLLWVNMIMDTLAALALATEEPVRHAMDQARRPLLLPAAWLHRAPQW